MTNVGAAAPPVPAPRGSVAALSLRPYQAEAVRALADGLRDGGQGQLHAACGSGKTLIARETALDLLSGGGGTVAVLAPSLALVAQTVKVWRELGAGADVNVLAVCSDDTVTVDPAGHLKDVPAPVTTDPADIARWLARPPGSSLRLLVGTYLSAGRLAEGLRDAGHELDLLILDEAHHITGPTDRSITAVADPRFLPSRRRLFMTATPRTDAGAERSESLSMSDESLFGPVLYSYPFSRGIAEGYLQDYQLYIVGIRESEARSLLSDPDREYVPGPGAPSLQTLVAQAALIRAAQNHGIRRALTFHHRVAAAQEFSRSLPALAQRLSPGQPAPYAACVHGEMDQALRDRTMYPLRHPAPGGWSAISNARCLGEGVDVPAIDAVLFAHPKSSAVDIIQAVGRALRPHPDTPGDSLVIVPLIVPEEDGEIGDLEPGDYRILWQVVRALRAHDEALGAALDQNRAHSPHINPGLPRKITVELPPGAAQDVLDQVTLMLVRQTTSPWWDGYAAAMAYREEHGHVDVPLRHVQADGFRLGNWLVKQRQMHGRGWLSAERAAALERLGIVWDPSEARWQQAYQQAAAWHQEHGHLDIPQTLAGAKRSQLGNWIVHQRQYRRAGTLAAHRISALDALGMIWDHRDQAFLEKLEALAAYKAEYGDLHVPQRHVTAHGIKLGAWVSQMRAKRASLPKDRIAALDAAGFPWTGIDAATQARTRALAAAESFYNEHGHLDVPQGTEHDGVQLGTWLTRQRALRRQGTVPADTLNGLERLGVNWEHRPRRLPDGQGAAAANAATAWQRGYALAVRYFAEHGHLNVPPGHGDYGMRLDAWLYRQRTAHRVGKLTPTQLGALTAIGMKWS